VLPLRVRTAAELERRYREGQAVYEEDMLHRQPGVRRGLPRVKQPGLGPKAVVDASLCVSSVFPCALLFPPPAGDAASMDAFEQPFQQAQQLVEQEVRGVGFRTLCCWACRNASNALVTRLFEHERVGA
jgi:hypothetical protein